MNPIYLINGDAVMLEILGFIKVDTLHTMFSSSASSSRNAYHHPI